MSECLYLSISMSLWIIIFDSITRICRILDKIFPGSKYYHLDVHLRLPVREVITQNDRTDSESQFDGHHVLLPNLKVMNRDNNTYASLRIQNAIEISCSVLR